MTQKSHHSESKVCQNPKMKSRIVLKASTDLTLILKVESIEIGSSGWSAYRMSARTQAKLEAPFVGLIKLHTQEGFAKTTDIEAFGRRETKGIQPVYEVHAMSSESLDAFRQWGWTAGYWSRIDSHPYNNINECRTPFTCLSSDRLKIDDVCLVDEQSNRLITRLASGKRVPVAFALDYISGHMTNEHYDLEKVVEILKDRESIFFHDDNGSVIEDPKKFIQPIPRYNREKPSDKHVLIRWIADQHDYERVIERGFELGGLTQQERKDLNEKRYSEMDPEEARQERAEREKDDHDLYGTVFCEIHRAIFDLDILGLRAGGAAKHSEYYGPNI